MPTNESPSYSSSRIQRATRINSIETVRLQQRLHCLEKAKLHQCRLTNQDIRLISLSIDYIQSSSGHSPEAWRPLTSPGGTDDLHNEEDDLGPCFMYGERIRSKKRRRFQRPMSAMGTAGESSSLQDDETEAEPVRPKSSPVKNRSASAVSFLNTNYDSDAETSLSDPSSRPPTALGGGRLTPHQDWEDETFEITKKIRKAQALANYGKPPLHHTTRNVRGLTRVTPVETLLSGQGDQRAQDHRGMSHPALDQDYKPRRPPEMTNFAGRRATLGEILSQRQPTLSAGAWKTHFQQTSATPLSISSHRQQVMEAKKHINDARLQRVNERVYDFMDKGHSTLRRSKSSLR